MTGVRLDAISYPFCQQTTLVCATVWEIFKIGLYGVICMSMLLLTVQIGHWAYEKIFFLFCLFIFHSLGPLQVVWFSSTPDFITEGKRIDLECYFSGWPFPQKVHWFKDDKIITNGAKGIFQSEDRRRKNGKETLHSKLSLPPGREELEGIYKCSAKNKISEVSEYLQLIYLCK